MDNFWIKIILAIVVIGAIVGVINRFRGPEAQPAPRRETVGDVRREDDKRLRAEPNVAGSVESNVAPANSGSTSLTTGGEPQVQFRELTVEQQAGAERLFEMAIASRKMARLPGMTYGQMVDYCRQIIEKYPGSKFEYMARQMLAETPREQWGRYEITEQEVSPAR